MTVRGAECGIYSQQQLQHKSIARLKQIYSEIGCTVEVSDKRCKDSWIRAIADYQSAHPEKFITPASIPLTPIEISFYDHEYYAGDKLIAAIRYDNDLTRPWVVMVNNKEVHRASTNILCHHYICSHYKDGTLPVQEEAGGQGAGCKGERFSPMHPAPCSLSSSPTENAIMAEIFNECEKYGFEILHDGIYNNEVKLGEVGCTDGSWWVVGAAEQERVACQSALVAVWRLAVAQTQLLNRRFEMLTPMDGSSYGSINELLN
ncbi:hypothetical protein LC605_30775 [Nostoc sp. CHAB 5836]|uniref:hypothetical protein n=1 Tax=Nostoc sp. CHAB 5836 TaxID=2780404 RepID=UPI001E3AA165|nr:hypothetical protein [Nostoc sp. CHAB 5836]MCC5619373.1 hypothetical protein [Nostoc sp. CHAB 5836]